MIILSSFHTIYTVHQPNLISEYNLLILLVLILMVMFSSLLSVLPHFEQVIAPNIVFLALLLEENMIRLLHLPHKCLISVII